MPRQVKQLFIHSPLFLVVSLSSLSSLLPQLLFRVLLQCGVDVDSRDIDGWTPLHAATHWGQEEVCTLLADHMCDMAAVNNVVSERPTTSPWH